MGPDHAMDHSFSLPMGSQPAARPMMDTAAPTRPPLPPSTSTVRRIPSVQTINGKTSNPNLYTHSTNSSVSYNTVSPSSTAPSLHPVASDDSMSDEGSLSPAEVVALARELMRSALEESGTSGMGNELKAGITIDLGDKKIRTFPEEVVDIIKRELQRLNLAHNQISSFPTRFAECTSLRYLNVRGNQITEFPMAICELYRLEILDISRNEIRSLPAELAKLKSLKVLSAQKNRIEELPICLAEMPTLLSLKFGGNPVRYPPKDVLTPQAGSPPTGAANLKEDECNDLVVTVQIKRYFKQKMIEQRSEADSGGEESSEGGHTPRPLKRVMSGRFPIKVNGNDVPENLRSPAMSRPPPIPSRSHYRGLSQQNAALRRPGITPLTIGNANERMRSNSESLLQRDKLDRTRRMGLVTAKKQDSLATVEEAKVNNRNSHLRAYSHGDALQSGKHGGVNGHSRQNTADLGHGRAPYVRRLSSLPEKKRDSGSPDPIIEGAKGILFALDAVNPLIESLMTLVTRESVNKRSSLEFVYKMAATYVDELDRDIQQYLTYSEEDEEVAPRSNARVHSTCTNCATAYIQVCTSLAKNTDTLVHNGDPRYIRKLLLSIYGSLVEVQNAGVAIAKHQEELAVVDKLTEVSEDMDETMNTLRPAPRDKAMTPTRERPSLMIPPVANPRMRSATVVQPSNLRVMTDSRTYHGHSGRSATMTAATPRSGESFTSVASSGRPTAEYPEEDRLFEKIFLGLQTATEMAISNLPKVSKHLIETVTLVTQTNSNKLKQAWQALVQRCAHTEAEAKSLRARLSLIKLKEPYVRTQPAFWELCNGFISSYYNMVMKVKEVKPMTTLLSNDVVALLRPLQKVLKETGLLIHNSPWSHLATTTPQSSNNYTAPAPYSANPAYGVLSPPPQTALPMTPASAALGPAVQATVPSTPASANYDTMRFHPNFNIRADAYIASSQNSSAFSSRAGTMTGSSFGGGVGSNHPTMTRSREEYTEAAGRGGTDGSTFSPPNGHVNGNTGSRFGGKVVF